MLTQTTTDALSEQSAPTRRFTTTVVIIPTFDERANAPRIALAVSTITPDADILFVDDSSPDVTGQIIDDLCAANSRINVLHRSRKTGLGNAYVAGFNWQKEKNLNAIPPVLPPDLFLFNEAVSIPDTAVTSTSKFGSCRHTAAPV